jgi:hypothetical protein
MRGPTWRWERRGHLELAGRACDAAAVAWHVRRPATGSAGVRCLLVDTSWTAHGWRGVLGYQLRSLIVFDQTSVDLSASTSTPRVHSSPDGSLKRLHCPIHEQPALVSDSNILRDKNYYSIEHWLRISHSEPASFFCCTCSQPDCIAPDTEPFKHRTN